MKRMLLLMLALGTLLEARAQWAKLDSTRLVVEPRFEVQYVDTLIDFGTGMKLRTQMCLPVTDGAFPVVVMRNPYVPAQIVFEALPILWQVKKGHRLRIDISSSNFPEYSIHSNYAGIWSLQTKTRVAHQTICVDAQHQSRIEIPF